MSGDSTMGRKSNGKSATEIRLETLENRSEKAEKHRSSIEKLLAETRLEVKGLKTRAAVLQMVGGGAFAIVVAVLGGLAAKIFGG